MGVADGIAREARIAIIGAGPAGLSAAWFLKRHGFERVTVFEEQGRVGGLCNTLTEDGCSFDLGANYVTPSYRETLKLAREVGAARYRARPWTAVRVPPRDAVEQGTQPLPYLDLFDVVRELRDRDGNLQRKVGLGAFVWALLKYVWKRFRLRGALDGPTLEHIHERPDLCVPFRTWLEREGLGDLRSLFEIPITLMGYGYLDHVAAPYALRFMSLGMFIPMLLRQVPGLGPFFPWPQRFVFGFQRMWEALSWRLDVRCNVKVRRITRSPDPADLHPIQIDFEHPQRIFRAIRKDRDTLWFDYLIVACMRAGSLGHCDRSCKNPVLDVTPEELDQFTKTSTYHFCVTTLHAKPGFRPKRPVVCAIPFVDETTDRPWALVQLWGGKSDMLQCYTKLPEEELDEITGRSKDRSSDVLPGVVRLVRLLGGDVYPIEGFAREIAGDEKLARWESYMQWPYFSHVEVDQMRDGWFADLERLQGRSRTFWVGGAASFEAVEPIVRYSKHLVERHFLGRAASY
jgi:hypothetical protein